MTIRALHRDDVAIFRDLRLFGMKESASAFGSTFEEASAMPLDELARRLEGGPEELVTFGGFEEALQWWAL